MGSGTRPLLLEARQLSVDVQAEEREEKSAEEFEEEQEALEARSKL